MSKKDAVYTAKLKHANPIDLMFGGNNDESTIPEKKLTQTIPIQEIKLSSTQPRRYFDPKKLEELSLSIKELGILEPLIARSLTDGGYELIAGERRFKAASLAGLEEVPVVIREMDDKTVKQVQLMENLQREDLNAYEETVGILELLALRLEITQDEVISLLNRLEKANRKQGEEVMRSKTNKKADNVIRPEALAIIEGIFSSLGRLSAESFRTNRLPLLNLPLDIKAQLEAGSIEYTKARAIATLKEDRQRQELLQRAIKENLSLKEIKLLLRDIRESEKVGSSPSLKSQYQELTKQLGTSKVWDNPKKKKALEKLLNQIKTLLEEEQNHINTTKLLH